MLSRLPGMVFTLNREWCVQRCVIENAGMDGGSERYA